jgi:DNA-binding transcriptional regulator YiaG
MVRTGEAKNVTGDHLYQLRMARGESQAEFGRHFGVVDSTISRWEDRGPPTAGAFARLIAYVMRELSTEKEK